MRMVDPDTTVHLVRVIPFDQQTGAWYTIENHGIETGECLLEPFLARQHNISHPPGLYEVTGKTTKLGAGTEWQRSNQPDVEVLAGLGFNVRSVPFTFPIDLELRRQLQSAAAEQGLTPNEFVQLAILEKIRKGLGE